MPRKPNPAPIAPTDTLDKTALAAGSLALTVVGERSKEISVLYGDGAPYDRDRVVGEARFFMSQSAEAMLETGKRLIQLKENEPHGDFLEILDRRLGMTARAAQKLMQAAVKYLAPALQGPNAPAPALLGLGKAKLLELLSEPDEDLKALASGGTVAGLNLDDIQSMSSRELRAALVEERQRSAAKDKVISRKDAKLNKLAEQEEIRLNGTVDEREQQQLAEIRDAGTAAELAMQRLVAVLDEVTTQPATEAAELQARQTIDYVLQRIADACAERGLAVEVLGEAVEPGWVRERSQLVDDADQKRKARKA